MKKSELMAIFVLILLIGLISNPGEFQDQKEVTLLILLSLGLIWLTVKLKKASKNRFSGIYDIQFRSEKFGDCICRIDYDGPLDSASVSFVKVYGMGEDIFRDCDYSEISNIVKSFLNQIKRGKSEPFNYTLVEKRNY